MTIPSKVMRETELDELETLSAHFQKGALHNTVRDLIANQRLLLAFATDLTKKVQYLLNVFYPTVNTTQYMFPDGDVWIVRPQHCCEKCLNRLREGEHLERCPNA